MELQELRVDALFLCELLSFDMEGHNRHFSGDTICHDLTAWLDKITNNSDKSVHCNRISIGFRSNDEHCNKRPHSLHLRTFEHVIIHVCLSWTNVLCFAVVHDNIDDSFHDPDGRWLLFELWLDPKRYIYLAQLHDQIAHHKWVQLAQVWNLSSPRLIPPHHHN